MHDVREAAAETAAAPPVEMPICAFVVAYRRQRIISPTPLSNKKYIQIDFPFGYQIFSVPDHSAADPSGHMGLGLFSFLPDSI